MNQKSSISYALQFAILLALLGIFLVISALFFSVIGPIILKVPLKEAMSATTKPENVGPTRLLNTLMSVLIFVCPAVLFARIISRKPLQQLGFNNKLNTRQLLTVIGITLAAIVLGGALGEINERIPLPHSWYLMAKASEEKYKAATMAMAVMHSLPDYFLSLLVLAGFPALCEEMIFRGALQPILIGWTKRKWAGIIITAVLFSLFHMSYFGFLTRAALGVVLGVLFYESRNIWLSVFLHFLNNAFVVTQLYIAGGKGKNIDKTLDESMPIWWGPVALVILLVFFQYFTRQTKKVLASKNQTISTETPIS
jgi:membrane protease YdiL (CAAX protease family)